MDQSNTGVLTLAKFDSYVSIHTINLIRASARGPRHVRVTAVTAATITRPCHLPLGAPAAANTR